MVFNVAFVLTMMILIYSNYKEKNDKEDEL